MKRVSDKPVLLNTEVERPSRTETVPAFEGIPTRPRTITRAPVCPECRSGKHGNCDGTALDEAADDIVECTCPPAFGHDPRTTR